LITAEREHQITSEGWTAEHDDQWTEGQLVDAACCYATFANHPAREYYRRKYSGAGYIAIGSARWPFDISWWKPSAGDDINGRILELVKAGALIAAEIDRLKRLEVK